jgi:hypothetical protein
MAAGWFRGPATSTASLVRGEEAVHDGVALDGPDPSPSGYGKLDDLGDQDPAAGARRPFGLLQRRRQRSQADVRDREDDGVLRPELWYTAAFVTPTASAIIWNDVPVTP